jgi:hypothetical protein
MSIQRKSQFGATLMIIGGLLAAAGEIVNALNMDVLSSSWPLSLGLIVIGTFILLMGLAIFASASNQISGFGFVGSSLLILGGLLAIVGTIALDWIILPFLIQLANTIASTVNGPATDAQNEINKLIASLNGLGGSALRNLLPGSPPDISAPHIPTIDGKSMVNTALTQLNLPTLDTLTWWGHFSLSGGPITIGCLILGLALLRGRGNLTLISMLLIIFSLLNLLCQFLSLIPVLGSNITAVGLFLTLAWLGFSAFSPQYADTRRSEFSEMSRFSRR